MTTTCIPSASAAATAASVTAGRHRRAPAVGLSLLAAALLTACADPSGIAGQSTYTGADALAAQRTLKLISVGLAATPSSARRGSRSRAASARSVRPLAEQVFPAVARGTERA